MPYIYDQEATRKNEQKWWTSHLDDYDMFMQAGSAGELGSRTASSSSASGARSSSIPATTPSGSDQAVDKLLAAQPLKVPVMLVAQPLGPGRHLRRPCRLQGDQAEGHGQRQGLPGHGPVASRPGDRRRQLAGRVEFGSDTGAVLPPGNSAARSSRQYLKDGAPKADVAAGHRVRDRHERVAPLARLACRLRERLHVRPRRFISAPV